MAKAPRITVYSTAKCSHCKQTEEFLKKYSVPFAMLDIERNPRAMKDFHRMRGRGVPLIVIGEQSVQGFDVKALKKALLSAGVKL